MLDEEEDKVVPSIENLAPDALEKLKEDTIF